MISIPEKPNGCPEEEISAEMLARMYRCSTRREDRRLGDWNYLPCYECPLQGKSDIPCGDIVFYLITKFFAEYESNMNERYDDGFHEGYNVGYVDGSGNPEDIVP